MILPKAVTIQSKKIHEGLWRGVFHQLNPVMQRRLKTTHSSTTEGSYTTYSAAQKIRPWMLQYPITQVMAQDSMNIRDTTTVPEGCCNTEEHGVYAARCCNNQQHKRCAVVLLEHPGASSG
ncbi:hypothetical protein E2C01_009971 [Portunus trituberculatus]|uniref:Uncharacterized protein n=1 Tax=Portunus trituberculatus TaxID=210409 RepID=A0A5B7D781_PORTR|nr:hypothetical protein [Portunus trituberculatus]